MIKEQAREKDLQNVLLADCRPISVQKILQVRVMTYPSILPVCVLQEEAVRMAQVQLNTLQAVDVLELMKQKSVDLHCYHLVHEL